jgi:hypothetical protein
MIEPRTPLTEFIKDITEILDEAQIEWIEKNKGYYIFKERTQLKELTQNQCKCEKLS